MKIILMFCLIFSFYANATHHEEGRKHFEEKKAKMLESLKAENATQEEISCVEKAENKKALKKCKKAMKSHKKEMKKESEKKPKTSLNQSEPSQPENPDQPSQI